MTGTDIKHKKALIRFLMPIGFIYTNVNSTIKGYKKNSYLFTRLIPAKKLAIYANFTFSDFTYFKRNNKDIKKDERA